MKHVRFRDPAGAVRTGEWDDGEVRFGGRSYDLDDVDVLAPCEPTKLVCIGRNYAAHAEEFGGDVPDRPMLFLKPPSAVAGHGDRIPLPEGKERIDYEAEVCVVISRQCRNVPASEAESVIEGYTCGVDVSNRDDQDREQNWIRGKAFDGAAPLGPVIAPPEDVPDDARIRLWVNGDLQQDATLDMLAFSIPELIEEITEYLTLEAGDVIMTGTPEGVGPLEDGDAVEVEVEGVGRLEHEVYRP